jgi:hypothetical protein
MVYFFLFIRDLNSRVFWCNLMIVELFDSHQYSKKNDRVSMYSRFLGGLACKAGPLFLSEKSDY